MTSSNPYEVLQLDQSSSYAEIKERYRHLTRNLHPDKQPLQNYNMTKKLFEQIDEAYKSIASPLRRFLFREYGMRALRVLEDMPNEFEEYDVDHMTPEQVQKLRQMMMYLLYEREACFQMDKTKFNTKSLFNISKLMKRISSKTSVSKTQAKRNLLFPQIQNTSFDYDMVLPECYQFSNSLAISHTSSNLRTDPKYMVGTTLTSVRRIYTHYMILMQGTVSTEEANFDLTFNKICENNLHLKVTPLSITNGVVTRPKFAIEKAYNQVQFSAVTDLSSVNFEFSQSNQKKVSKSLKLYIEGGSIGLIPRVEWQVAQGLRLFVQTSSAFNFNPQDNQVSIHQNLNYGYKLVLQQDLKLQLASCIGYPNYFQLSLISSKYRVTIPFAAAQTDSSKFQALKILTMITTYIIVQGYNLRKRTNERNKKRYYKEQESRIKEAKRELQKQSSYVQIGAMSRKEKQIKYNGLVVVKVILGESHKIKDMLKVLKKAKLKENLAAGNLPQEISSLEQTLSNMLVLPEQTHCQVADITLLVQNEVQGAQLIDYNLEDLQKYNPVIFDSIRPDLLFVYVERGHLRIHSQQCQGKLSLGGFRERGKGWGDKVKRGWAKVKNYFMLS